MSKFGILLIGIVLLLTSCSVASAPTNLGSPELETSDDIATSTTPSAPASKNNDEVATKVTDEQISNLIRSLPKQKSLDGLKAHFQAIDQAASQLEPFKIEYTTGPTTVKSKVEKVVAKFSEKLKMYQFLGLESLNQDWVLASEKDYQWWVDYRSAQDPSFPVNLWNEKTNDLGHCRLSSDVFCGAGNGLGGKNYQDNIVGTSFTGRGLDSVSRHESAHFYQAVFGYGGRCWMAEGQATFFETYLETSSRSRSEVLSRLSQSPAGVAKLSESKLLELLTSDQICQEDSNVAYDLGMLGYEYLYMNYSFWDVHELQVLSSTKSWEQAVSEYLGLDATKLNRQLSSYIFNELN
jgi:hypothetical protein